MTSPNQANPDGALGPGDFAAFQAMTEDQARAAMRGGVQPHWEGAQDAAHGAYNSKIDDHTQSITEIQAVINTLILQGDALKYVSNGTYTPNPNVVTVEVINIAAGGGGSSGSQDVVVAGTRSGGGGGGGGEVHAPIPASLLPTNIDGTFKSLQVIIGAGGAGALVDSDVGTGGGHTKFGPEVGSGASEYLLAGGGQGGQWGNSGPIAQGGAGMIPGGNGGRAVGDVSHQTLPGSSTSAFDLHGGGGGGGAGYAQGKGGGQAGGNGAVAPGGAPGTPGSAGSSPSAIVAVGGGGGGGGLSGSAGGGNGGYPGGGGGGSACSTGGATFGGNGADGVLYIIERMA